MDTHSGQVPLRLCVVRAIHDSGAVALPKGRVSTTSRVPACSGDVARRDRICGFADPGQDQVSFHFIISITIITIIITTIIRRLPSASSRQRPSHRIQQYRKLQRSNQEPRRSSNEQRARQRAMPTPSLMSVSLFTHNTPPCSVGVASNWAAANAPLPPLRSPPLPPPPPPRHQSPPPTPFLPGASLVRWLQCCTEVRSMYSVRYMILRWTLSHCEHPPFTLPNLVP